MRLNLNFVWINSKPILALFMRPILYCEYTLFYSSRDILIFKSSQVLHTSLCLLAPPTPMTSSQTNTKAPFDLPGLGPLTLLAEGRDVPSAWCASQDGAPLNGGCSLVFVQPATPTGPPWRRNIISLVNQLCSLCQLLVGCIDFIFLLPLTCLGGIKQLPR